MELVRRIASRPLYLVAAMVVDIFVCGWVFSIVEHHGPIEGPWWALVTGSTTGYGDLYPKTTAGRGVAAFLMVTMVAMVALLTAQLAARLVPDPHLFTDEEQRALFDRLGALEEQNNELLDEVRGLRASLVTGRT